MPKSAVNLLSIRVEAMFALVSAATALSIAGLWLFPRSLPIPSRKHFPSADDLYKGAVMRRVEIEKKQALPPNMWRRRDGSLGGRLSLIAALNDGATLAIEEIPVRVRRYEDFQIDTFRGLVGTLDTAGSGDSDGFLARAGSTHSPKAVTSREAYAVGGDRIVVSEVKSGAVIESCLLPTGIGFASQLSRSCSWRTNHADRPTASGPRP